VQTPSDRAEDDQEQLNRQLSELLQELRVAMPGVQLLFGFLLAAAFNQRFAELDQFQEDVYLATLICSAMASAFFIAPTAYHRIMFQHRDKPQLIRTATRMAIAGLTFLAVAMTGAVLLVTDFLFDRTTTIVVTAVVAAAFAWLWFGLALSRRLLGMRSH
jgi:VIT1/CCC1 family predicted Fe2+/Mn2+ transporter